MASEAGSEDGSSGRTLCSLVASCLRLAGVAASLGMGAWLACWMLWLGAAWWGVAAVLVGRGARWSWVPAGLVGFVLVPACVVGYAERVEVLTERVRRGGPTALELHDRVAIYGLNLVMAGVGGLLGFPEAAWETASLALPGRVATAWTSDVFPLCDPDIARVVASQRDSLTHDGASAGPTRVSWPGYAARGISVRGALALYPAEVRSAREGDRLVTRTTVPIDYQGFYALRLGRLGPMDVVVEEGLFHALQQLGWLHPYRLTWEVSLPLDAPLPPPCEAWSVRLVESLL